MLDNQVIIKLHSPVSHKIQIPSDVPAVLLKATGQTTNNARLRLTRMTKGGNAARNQLPITESYQKIKLHPYEMLQLEITDWGQLNPNFVFSFRVLSGTHHELLFRDIEETLVNYHLSAIDSNAFVIGNPKGSHFMIKKDRERFRCLVRVDNESFTIRSDFDVAKESALERMAANIVRQVSAHAKPKAQDYYSNRFDAAFSALINRHFRPSVY